MKLHQSTRIALAICITIYVAGCSKSVSPSATMQEFTTAVSRNDVEGFKQTLSAASLLLIEKEPLRWSPQNRPTVNDSFEAVIKQFQGIPNPARTRGESIDGNKATLYWVDTPTNSTQRGEPDHWQQLKLVKEDGKWKIDLFRKD